MLRVGLNLTQQNISTNKKIQPEQKLGFGTNIGPNLTKTLKSIGQDLELVSKTSKSSIVNERLKKFQNYLNNILIAKKDNNPGLTVDYGGINSEKGLEIIISHEDYPQVGKSKETFRKVWNLNCIEEKEVLDPCFLKSGYTDCEQGLFMRNIRVKQAELDVEAEKSRIAAEKQAELEQSNLLAGIKDALAEITGEKVGK